jgi:hypothetical protein
MRTSVAPRLNGASSLARTSGHDLPFKGLHPDTLTPPLPRGAHGWCVHVSRRSPSNT